MAVPHPPADQRGHHRERPAGAQLTRAPRRPAARGHLARWLAVPWRHGALTLAGPSGAGRRGGPGLDPGSRPYLRTAVRAGRSRLVRRLPRRTPASALSPLGRSELGPGELVLVQFRLAEVRLTSSSRRPGPIAAMQLDRLAPHPARLARDRVTGVRLALGGRIPADRARHAPGTAATAAQLAAGHLDDLDAGRLEPGNGLGVALVADGQAPAQREGVVAIAGLAAAPGDRLQAGIDDLESLDP